MTERPALTIDVAAARDIKTLSAALDDASTLVVRCTTERFKRVVTALLKAPRARLVDLSLIISDFDPGGEVGKPALTTKATDALWAALPALTRLVLRGHALCRGIAHPTLEHLDVEGYAFGAGAVPTQGACPRLRTLRWGFCGDEYGVALEPVALEALWSQSLPALRTLDLSGADIDGSLLSESSFLKAPLISQLTTLGLPSGTTDDWQAVLGALPGLAELRVASPSLAGRHPKVTVIEPPEDDGAAGAAGEAYELNNVNDAGLKKAKLITRAGPLRQLTVSYHSLQVEGARLLGQSAAAHPELEALNLNKPATRGWRKDALEAFAVALGTHPGLKALHLRKNQLDGAGGIISGLLARLPNLELLELSQTELDANDLREVIPAISRLPRLRTLLMGGLEATEASAVAWKVLSSATLQNLELWTSAFESGWSSVFHQMGRRLPALERLHVDGGHLPTAATAALADAFHGHQRLSALRIELAPTTGAYQMLGALMSSSPITHLVLEESSSRSDPGEARDVTVQGVG
ncbi:MAG: hypothetical protein IAE78_06605 [Myxococcus sp.]|nr:hypothetical protein [Myxococcus sp.]